MPTANYNLPTISGEEVIDLVGDMNALANATDAALKKVEDGGLDPYVLPTASRTVKGGVIVGDGLTITSGGVLSATSGGGGGGSSYTLPVASSSTLGGVKIGSGVSITGDGTISVSGGSGGTVADSSVTESKIASGAVTSDKIASGAVTSAKLDSTVAQDIADAKSKATSAYNDFNGSPSVAGSFSSGKGAITAWGKVVILTVDAVNVASAARTQIGTVSSAYRPMRTTTGAAVSYTGDGVICGFVQVNTNGAVYLNPGTKAGEDWSATLAYLIN